jgi:anion-transporting  ArsA/GET3 family ATPase
LPPETEIGDADNYARRRMDIAAFCTESKVLVVAGKGGVGKSTASAALALTAAEAGLSVLLVELEGKPAVAAAFGCTGPLDYEDVALHEGTTGSVRGRWITPDDALLEYLADHGFQRVSRRLVKAGVIDVVSTAIPGIRDVLVLGKIKQLERSGAADVLIIDAPATGHAVTFLTSASGLLDAARGGPIRAQAADVLEMLNDPARCRVLLVTLPEDMPVSETIEAAYRLEDEAGVQLGPVIVNAVEGGGPLDISATEAAEEVGTLLPASSLEALEAARDFAMHRRALQSAQIERLAAELPLPQLQLPVLDTPVVGPAQLAELAGALGEGIAHLSPEAAWR